MSKDRTHPMVKNHAAKAAARKLKAESGITYPRALDLVRAAGYGSSYPDLTIGLAAGAPVKWQPRPGSRLEITGATGTGKSELMAFLASQAANAGIEVFIVDLDKRGPEYNGITNAVIAWDVDEARSLFNDLESNVRPAVIFFEGIPKLAFDMDEAREELAAGAGRLAEAGYPVVASWQFHEARWEGSDKILLGRSTAGQRTGFFGTTVGCSAGSLEGHFLQAGRAEPLPFKLCPGSVLPAGKDPLFLPTGYYPRFRDLRLPAAVRQFATVDPGLVVFAGLTGSGSSTSMAATVNIVTERFARRVTVIEADRELLIRPGHSEIQYKVLGKGSGSMAHAIEDAVREVRDVIVIGEVRDGAALNAAVRAAQAGHTVFMTIHAKSAADVPKRITEMVSAEGWPEIEADLAEVLRGVLFQTLVAAVGEYPTRVPAVEMLPIGDAASAMIQAFDYKGLAGFVSKQEQGCIPLSVSLSQLVLDGMASEEAAEKATGNPMAFRRALHAGKRHSNPFLTLGTDTTGDVARFHLGANSHLLVVSTDGRRRAAALDAIAGRFPGDVTRVVAGDLETALIAIRQDISSTIRTVRDHGGVFNALPLEVRKGRRCVLLDISPAMQASENSIEWQVQLTGLHREAGMAGVTLLLGVETVSQLMLLSGAFQSMDSRMFLDGISSYSSHRGSTVEFSPDWESETAAA